MGPDMLAGIEKLKMWEQRMGKKARCPVLSSSVP
jgi:hypothetical protein